MAPEITHPRTTFKVICRDFFFFVYFVQALKGRLARVEALVDLVHKRADLDLLDQVGAHVGLAVQDRQQRAEHVAHEMRLVVGRRVERRQRHSAHIEAVRGEKKEKKKKRR